MPCTLYQLGKMICIAKTNALKSTQDGLQGSVNFWIHHGGYDPSQIIRNIYEVFNKGGQLIDYGIVVEIKDKDGKSIGRYVEDGLNRIWRYGST